MSEEAKKKINEIKQGKLPKIPTVDNQSEKGLKISERGLNISEYGLQTKNNSKKKDK